MKQKHILLSWVLFFTAAMSGCAATSDEAAESPELPATAAAEQQVQSKGEPPTSGDPSTMACSSWTNINCNPDMGGTAYCRQRLQEQSAWCARPKPGFTAVCCYP